MRALPPDLVSMLSDLLWVCAPDGRSLYLSESWSKYTGKAVDALMGMAWVECIHPDDRAGARALWSGPFDGALSHRAEFRIEGVDGGFHWFRSHAMPVRDGSGAVTSWAGSSRDVQDLKEVHERLARANEVLEAHVTERTSALQEVNNQLAIAQSVAHMGSWSFNVASDEVEWSEELFRIVGLDERTAAPNYAAQEKIFAPLSWAKLTAAVGRCIELGEPYEFELELTRPNNERRTAIARGRAVRDANGAVRQLVGTLHDVTELVVARRTQEQLAERLRLATTSAGVGIWEFTLGADSLLWDRQMYSLYGLEPQPGGIEKRSVWDTSLHPGDHLRATEELRVAIAGGAPFDTSFRIVRPDGGVRHLRAAAVVIRDVDGVPLRMVGVNWDVTSERVTEMALVESKALLDLFVRHAPVAIAMFDTEMRYLQTSEQWVTDYKLTGQPLIGRSHYEVFPDIPERWKAIHQRVLAGATERCAEDPFPRASGGTVWLQWEARAWHHGDGTVGGLVFFTQDISARKYMEQLLETRKERLERSNKDLEQFAAAASHDLQEPLRAVSGCAQILQTQYKGQLDPAADALIGHIVDGASRMRALITGLLTFSRVSSHGEPFRMTDSAEVCRSALANLSASIEESGAVIEMQSLPEVQADPSQLAQVFQNLIGNALKYRSKAPPVIRISASQNDEDWVFCVQDNGIGIESVYFEKIFALFQRLHTRDEYPGTGIGLALCQKIIERHRGRIWVESNVGHGTIFFFTLPKSSGVDAR